MDSCCKTPPLVSALMSFEITHSTRTVVYCATTFEPLSSVGKAFRYFHSDSSDYKESQAHSRHPVCAGPMIIDTRMVDD